MESSSDYCSRRRWWAARTCFCWTNHCHTSDVARERRLTVLLIAHDVNPLLSHIDHVLYVAQGRLAMGKPADIITSESLSSIYSAPVEVLRDSRGRVFVVGLEEEVSHPHG